MTLDLSLINQVVRLAKLNLKFGYVRDVSLVRGRYQNWECAIFLPGLRRETSVKLESSSCLYPLQHAGISCLSEEEWNELVDAVTFCILNSYYGWSRSEYDTLLLRCPNISVPSRLASEKEKGIGLLPEWAKELPIPISCPMNHLYKDEGELPMASEKRKFFEQRAFIEGEDVSLISHSDIFARISEQEKRINVLKGIKAQPAVLLETITTMESELDALIKYLDSSKQKE